MQLLACPSCGGEVKFRSRISVFGVCPYCRSTLVRHDDGLEKIGQMAELPEDLTPFQIGTRGFYGEHPFTLAGRLHVGWKDGAWNEWFAVMSDEKDSWLAEAQGFYMFSQRMGVPPEFPAARAIKRGLRVKLGPKQVFQVDDFREVAAIASDGELPFQALQGRQGLSVDLSAPGGRFASIEYSLTEGVRLYVGRYLEFDELRLTELRTLDGW